MPLGPCGCLNAPLPQSFLITLSGIQDGTSGCLVGSCSSLNVTLEAEYTLSDPNSCTWRANQSPTACGVAGYDLTIRRLGDGFEMDVYEYGNGFYRFKG